jgi:hypothetical protein
MNSDLGFLEIDKVIIHDVPKHSRNETGAPILSDIESDLDDELQIYFREKIIGSITSALAFDIKFDPTAESPLPQLIFRYLSTPGAADFISISRQMAGHLFSIQTGSNPAGLLVLVHCTIRTKRHSPS